jgi:hypothetical protein
MGGRTYSLEVGNMPMACTLEEEKKKKEAEEKQITEKR